LRFKVQGSRFNSTIKRLNDSTTKQNFQIFKIKRIMAKTKKEKASPDPSEGGELESVNGSAGEQVTTPDPSEGGELEGENGNTDERATTPAPPDEGILVAVKVKKRFRDKFDLSHWFEPDEEIEVERERADVIVRRGLGKVV
jgi:hypothetical protein